MHFLDSKYLELLGYLLGTWCRRLNFMMTGKTRFDIFSGRKSHNS
jgi:hypothetical protein